MLTFAADPAHKLEVEPLGKLIFRKTQGNPFFVNQLLTTLYKNGHIHFASVIDGQSSEQVRGGMEWLDLFLFFFAFFDLICFNHLRRCVFLVFLSIFVGWMYDMEAIQEENYTSNVVELMVSMLRYLQLFYSPFYSIYIFYLLS